jgi:hypothetical protein
MSDCFETNGPRQGLVPQSWSSVEESILLFNSIRISRLFLALQTRGAYLFDATRRIVHGSTSLPLEKDQWKLEMRRLFDMTLIRLKTEMLYIARGTRSNLEEVEDRLQKDEPYRGLCRKYKFSVKGHKNLSLLGIMTSLFVPLFLGLETGGKVPAVWIAIGIWKGIGLAHKCGGWMFAAVSALFPRIWQSSKYWPWTKKIQNRNAGTEHSTSFHLQG